jgi:hypothetical protein
MYMPSTTGRNWPEAIQPLEKRRQARVVASFAEFLAEDVRGHPNRALDAMGALAEWCEDDPELLEYARRQVVRDTSEGPSAFEENNRHAIQLLDLVRSAS